MTSNQCPYCGYEDGKHNVVCIAAELQRVYALVSHWAGEEKRLRAALERIVTRTKGCNIQRAATDAYEIARTALSGDSSAPEPRKPCSICGSTEHSHLHCYGPVHETSSAPALPTDELSREIERRLFVAVRETDAAFEKAGATGTKSWVRDFLLSRLEAQGLGIGMKAHLQSPVETKPDGEDSYIHGPGTFPHADGCRCARCSPPETPARCTCGSTTGQHAFNCQFRRDGDDGKGSVKASTHPACIWRDGCKHPEVCNANLRCVPGGIEGQS